jgi:hypothetical protein
MTVLISAREAHTKPGNVYATCEGKSIGIIPKNFSRALRDTPPKQIVVLIVGGMLNRHLPNATHATFVFEDGSVTLTKRHTTWVVVPHDDPGQPIG